MRNGAKNLWILAYVLGVGLLSSGVSIACTYMSDGEFYEDPSAYYGAWADEECLEEPWNAPRCGYFMCVNSLCGTYSMVTGCTWATTWDMYDYMHMGCRSEGCQWF